VIVDIILINHIWLLIRQQQFRIYLHGSH